MTDNPAKSSRPIESPLELTTLAVVLTRPSFLAFCRIVGLRIQNGQSADAYAMLESLGCASWLVHQIIERWPTDKAHQRLDTVGLTPDEEAACRFAHFVDDVDAYNWADLLVVAVSAAEEKRSSRLQSPGPE